jgi:Uma2 family endonuclease
VATALAPRLRPRFTGRRYTVDDLRRLARVAEPRFELFDGHLLVSPGLSTRHQWVCAELFHHLYDYVAGNRLGRVDSPGAIIVPPGIEFQPDILVSQQRATNAEWTDVTERWLVVEVLSYWTRETDLGSKRSAYLEIGVAELWLVDPVARTVTIARRDAADVVSAPPATHAWRAPQAQAPLMIDVASPFLTPIA